MIVRTPRAVRRRSCVAAMLSFLASSAAGCGTKTPTCSPGSTAPCACSDGSQSEQVCTSDGLSYGACSCSTGITAYAPANTTLAPFSTLVIDGGGFDPTDAALSLVFTPASSSGASSMAIPAMSATGRAVGAIVPPLNDPSGGGFSSGATGVQVVRVSATSLMASNVVTGLQIGPLPTPPSSIPAGEITRAFLDVTLDLIQQTWTKAAVASPQTSAVLNDLSDLGTELAAIESQVKATIAAPGSTGSLTTTDGEPFTIDLTLLAQLDRLILGYLQQMDAQLDATSTSLPAGPITKNKKDDPQTGPACPPGYVPLENGNNISDNAVCGFWDQGHKMYTQGGPAVEGGAELVAASYLGLFGDWMALAVTEVGVLSAEGLKARELLWTFVTPYITSWSLMKPAPPLSDALAGVGKKAIEGAVPHGLPSATAKAINAYGDASKVTGTTADYPNGGLVLSGATTGSSGCGTVDAFLVSSGSAVEQRLPVPCGQQTVDLGGGGNQGSSSSGGGSSSGGPTTYSCTSVYDGTYSGTLNFSYDTAFDSNGNPTASTTSSRYLSVTMHCYASTSVGIVMTVTNAISTEPAFGCASPGCVPTGTMGFNGAVTLPAMPPTSASNPSAAGMGIDLTFPNGATFTTSNGAGDLSVSAGAMTLSSSATAPTNQTWLANDSTMMCVSEQPGAQPGEGCCTMVPYMACDSTGNCQMADADSCTRYTSWSLSKTGP